MGGSLTEDEILDISNITKTPLPMVFIETGTYKGDSTRVASKLFTYAMTIEVSQERYEESVGNCKECKNIMFYLGDSLYWLPTIVEQAKNEKGFWFLDAHISGHDSMYNGKQLVPLIEELEIITPTLTEGSIVVVDDVRLFSQNDWAGVSMSSINAVFKKHHKKIRCELVKNDRLIIVV